jgi:acetamidase/formamidase
MLRSVDWIEELYDIDRHHAVALASLTVVLRISQIVNQGVKGVHAVLPGGAIRLTHGSTLAPTVMAGLGPSCAK